MRLPVYFISHGGGPWPWLKREMPGIYDQLEARAAQLTAWTPPGVTINRVGSMWTLFFTETPVTDLDTAKTSDVKRFGRFFWEMMGRGVYLPCSQFEANFVSAAHTRADIDATISAAKDVLQSLKT